MKTVFIFLFCFSLCLAYSKSDLCNCIPKVGEKKPFRLTAKWETKGKDFPRAKKEIQPSSLYTWETKYSKFADSSTVIWKTPRLTHTPEESLYTMKGWLWFVKKEKDCDFHIQIGRKNKGAFKRAVVELTVKQCSIQKELLDTLIARGYTITQIDSGLELEKGIKVTVEGLGFYDWQHQLKEPAKNPPENSPLWKQEGTAWELHPVINMAFEK